MIIDILEDLDSKSRIQFKAYTVYELKDRIVAILKLRRFDSVQCLDRFPGNLLFDTKSSIMEERICVVN